MRHVLRGLAGILPLIVLLQGCGGSDKEEPRTQAPVPQSVQSAGEPATLTLTVVYEGTVPRGSRIRMAADPKCAALHSSDVEYQAILLGEGKGVQDVFVYVKEGLGNRTFPVPAEPAVLDQRGCLYEPRVLGVQVNQPIQIRNSDPTLHNINARPQTNSGFNIAQPVQGMQTSRTFNRPEVMIPVKCDVHPWMASHIGVMNHPYFGVTGPEGKVILAALPPGEYVIAAWHERLGTLEQTVSIGAGEKREVVFRFGGTT